LAGLEADSEGLLLMSDEVALNEKLLHPRHGHAAVIGGRRGKVPSPESLRTLETGVADSRAQKLAWQGVVLERSSAKMAQVCRRSARAKASPRPDRILNRRGKKPVRVARMDRRRWASDTWVGGGHRRLPLGDLQAGKWKNFYPGRTRMALDDRKNSGVQSTRAFFVAPTVQRRANDTRWICPIAHWQRANGAVLKIERKDGWFPFTTPTRSVRNLTTFPGQEDRARGIIIDPGHIPRSANSAQ